MRRETKPLTSVAAAIEILRSEGRPMTGREIIELATKRGLVNLQGKTPERTLLAELYIRIRDMNFPIRRIAQSGPTRAKRGSVRWVLKKTPSAEMKYNNR